MADRPAPLVVMAGPDPAEPPFGSYAAVIASGRHLLAAELSQRLGRAGAAVASIPVSSRAESFHWGRWFAAGAREVLAAATGPLDAIGWAGAGAVSLLPDAGLDDLLSPVAGEVVANNRYSADAFVVAGDLDAALTVIEAVESDNAVPRALEAAGFALRDLGAHPFSRFDVDTPQDLALLRLATRLPGTRPINPALAAFLDGVQLPGGRGLEIPRLDEVLGVLRNREAELFVAGRVPSATFAHLEREAACRVRLLVEERGMRAAAGHRPQSVLTSLLADHGAAGLIVALADFGQAAVLDSRVLMAAVAGSSLATAWPPAEERYAADFGDAARSGTGWLGEVTAAAGSSPVPILMGGHALVSDGLRILTDVAWQGRPPMPIP